MFEMKGLRIVKTRTAGSFPRTTASLAACVSRGKSDTESTSMNRSWRMCAAVSVVALLGGVWPTWTSVSRGGSNDKVEICHFPPGNPGNYQTITIGASALASHLAHGDFPGPCANDCRLFGSLCDDGNLCTTDTCNADGTCAHSTPTNCDDSNVCTADSCDPNTGNCVNAPLTGGTCDDGNDCTSSDTCNRGSCVGQQIRGCCKTIADCDDGNLCTIEACTNRTCSNTPVSCPAPDRCTIATCNPSDGSCELAPISCDDDNACTTDTCDSATGCHHEPVYVCGDAVCNLPCENASTCPADCIGAGSCAGLNACQEATGQIGAGSCIGTDACKFATGQIGDGSCNSDVACFRNSGNVGDNSCNGFRPCESNGGNIGNGSCTGHLACNTSTGDVGDGSCSGSNACQNNTGNVGNGSCNADQACCQNATNRGDNVCDTTCACDGGCFGVCP